MKRQRRPITKIVTTAVLYLLAGVITTITVAWGVVILDREEPTFTGTALGGWIVLPDGLAMISIGERRGPASQFHNVYVWSWVEHAAPADALAHDERYQQTARLPSLLYDQHVHQTLADHFGQSQVQIRIESRGWPMPALWCAPFIKTSAGVERDNPVLCGIALGKTNAVVNNAALNKRTMTLPMMPLWGGFTVDAIALGFTWFVVFFLAARTRRFIRARRGRCPRCGYVMKNHETNIRGCPECGYGRA